MRTVHLLQLLQIKCLIEYLKYVSFRVLSCYPFTHKLSCSMVTGTCYILFILNFPKVGNKSQSTIFEYNILLWKTCSKGKNSGSLRTYYNWILKAQVIVDILKEVVHGLICRGEKESTWQDDTMGQKSQSEWRRSIWSWVSGVCSSAAVLCPQGKAKTAVRINP